MVCLRQQIRLGTLAHQTALTIPTQHLDTATERLSPRIPDSHHTQHNMSATQSVQCFGKKKTATAVAHCKQGKGLIKVNGRPLGLVEPQILRFKVYEPVLILGLDKFCT